MDRRLSDNKRMFGFKVGRRWVATCGDFERRLTVPGGAGVPTAAVTVVSVHSPYRRRGLLTAMMKHQLEQVAKRGEPLAGLWASESQIYGRFGYGPATSRAMLEGNNQRLRFLAGVGTSGSVDEVTRDEFLTVASGLHESMRPDRPGTMVRDKDVWEFAAYDMEFSRGGASELRYVLHYDEIGDADGFATYRFKDKWDEEPEGEVRIREIWAEDPAAHAGLWRYLLDLDLARTFTWSGAPVDEPLRHLVTDARAVGTSISDSLYVRVVDVQAALAARQYAAGVDLVIEIDDPILPENTGCYRIVTDGRPRGVECRGHPREVSTRHLDGHPGARDHLPGRRTPERPGASPPCHRAHPAAAYPQPRRPSAGTGPLGARTTSDAKQLGGLPRGEPMTWVLRELSARAAAQ